MVSLLLAAFSGFQFAFLPFSSHDFESKQAIEQFFNFRTARLRSS